MSGCKSIIFQYRYLKKGGNGCYAKGMFSQEEKELKKSWESGATRDYHAQVFSAPQYHLSAPSVMYELLTLITIGYRVAGNGKLQELIESNSQVAIFMRAEMMGRFAEGVCRTPDLSGYF